ncbi:MULTISPECIES: hypothetical protein [Cupriavidus]|uniref:Copper resistance protein CopQ n=1 Tax=Cupriavidus taiwanensis TaxID=164546 RepID=A0A976FXD2_9BURK|nr:MULTISPECIES: hypothetical protein [Cupriavidus]MEC3764173.1 hypothetical protein [Cupriavidus sp. SS-3]SOY93233.1 conserved hypothetical protein; putative exported protein [Cupriavidus taiwanensis]SOY96520.1 conserved hypothetical protein; putative exported protein [Cupriavidus taiwanensis]SPD68951.1 conserved exported protein of unknown function [Cupriavidus taiwanensis]
MTKTTRLASALLLTLAALGAAQAATAADVLPGDKYGYSFRSTVPGDKYGYEFRSHDAFTDGARAGKADPFTDGARTGKADPFTDGARTVAGLDRSGVSASPARGFDTFTEGSRTGKFDPYGEGARA